MAHSPGAPSVPKGGSVWRDLGAEASVADLAAAPAAVVRLEDGELD